MFKDLTAFIYEFYYAVFLSLYVTGMICSCSGTIMPSLIDQWKISAVEAGLFSSYALFGMMIGALIFGPLADKFGRKKIILICTVLFSLLTFTSRFADTPTSFGVQRFVAGLGLGGVMPNLIAIITEYSPKNLPSTLVAIMFSGHALGGVVAALGAMYLIPNYGWRAVVWMGVLPLILCRSFINCYQSQSIIT